MSQWPGSRTLATGGFFCNSVSMPPSRRTGTRVAFAALVPRFLCAAALALGGCLITDPAQIGEPVNSPPAIRSTPEAESSFVALNQIVRVDYDPGGELALPIIVRDENLADELLVQVWIDYRPALTGNGFTGFPLYPDPLPKVLPTGSPDREEYWIRIAHTYFGETDRCHRVEVFVTRGFLPTAIPHRIPEDPGDLGTATFWVAMNAAGGVIDMDACP